MSHCRHPFPFIVAPLSPRIVLGQRSGVLGFSNTSFDTILRGDAAAADTFRVLVALNCAISLLLLATRVAGLGARAIKRI
jgi:hypothetical protein